MERSVQGLEKLLDQAGYRVTRARRAILNLVEEQDGRFSAEELVERVQQVAPGTGRATVYRTLDLLAALRLVERVHLQEGSHSYVRGDVSRPHHHHLICSACGTVVEFEGCEIPQLAETVAARTGFTVEGHQLEVYGRCASCAPSH